MAALWKWLRNNKWVAWVAGVLSLGVAAWYAKSAYGARTAITQRRKGLQYDLERVKLRRQMYENSVERSAARHDAVGEKLAQLSQEEAVLREKLAAVDGVAKLDLSGMTDEDVEELFRGAGL